MIRTYKELCKLKTFEERYEYLRIKSIVGDKTFGYDRYLNQLLYSNPRWKKTRYEVIVRDDGCDLGMEGYRINTKILVHHMNPITIEDVEQDRDHVYDPEYLICTAFGTHNAIHFGNTASLPRVPKERSKNDTCPWRQ